MEYLTTHMWNESGIHDLDLRTINIFRYLLGGYFLDTTEHKDENLHPPNVVEVRTRSSGSIAIGIWTVGGFIDTRHNDVSST